MNSPKHDPWERLYRYWLSKHADGHPPARADLDPLIEIPSLVANLMILEVRGDGYLYRLAGSEVVKHAGVDMTGKRVGYSNLHKKAMPGWLETLDFVRINAAPRMVVSHFAEQRVAKNIVLVLPLRSGPDGPPMLLIGSFYKGYFELGMKIAGVTVTEISIAPDQAGLGS